MGYSMAMDNLFWRTAVSTEADIKEGSEMETGNITTQITKVSIEDFGVKEFSKEMAN